MAMKRFFAMIMALCICLSAMPLQALAAEETTTETGTETSPEGLVTDVTTTTTTTTDENGNTTVTITIDKSTEGTTEDGALIEREESSTEITFDSADGLETSTSYVEEGSETITEVVPSDDEISVDVIVDGEVQEDASGSSETADTTVSGDIKTGEDDAEYDQTTVTTTDRTADVTVEDITVSTGVPVYIDENGNIVGRTDEGYNYYWSDIYSLDGKSIIDGEAPSSQWTTGRYNGYIVNADGSKSAIRTEGVCQRVVAHDNGTPDDYSDDYEVGGLYCVDMSTGIRQELKYRKANLEDADYYTEEEISHLRAIMTYGYTWDDDDDNGYTNLEEMKAMLKDAQANGDEATKELLKDLDFDKLTREQAATATGMAVWTYGNRFVLEEGQYLEFSSQAGDATIDAVYQYLASLTKEADEDETQIINEEKFIDDMEFVVGGMVKGNESNADDDDTNDVYNVDLKFSLVIEPSQTGDDLIVKVLDSEGKVVKTARIAGEQKEGEDFGYAQTSVDENGKTYYVLEGLQLAENSNTTFNLKLEGTQLLKEGVYIFESQQLTGDEQVDRWIEYYKDSGVLDDYIEECGSLEELRKMIALELENNGYLGRSQNFIGKYEGTAEVDVCMEINLTFNVEESVVTTERIWRTEYDPVVELEEPQTPQIFRLTNQTGGEEIPDEQIPLADAPKTGDMTSLVVMITLMAAMCLAVMAISDKKRRA